VGADQLGDVVSTAEVARTTPWPRRLTVVVAIGALALLVVAVAGPFLWNTESLATVTDVGPVSPGQSVTIDLPAGDERCGPSFEHLFRPTYLGRWQLTHVSDDGLQWTRHERGLLSRGSWSDVSPLPCPISRSAELVIPSDVTWSPVVACSFNDENCVRVDVSTR